MASHNRRAEVVVAIMLIAFLAGCASGPPARDAAWWEAEVKRDRPTPDDDGQYHPRGKMDRILELDADEALELKWIEFIDYKPRRVVHVQPDGSGYIVIEESWQDGEETKSIMRKLEFELEDGDLRELRGILTASGALRLNPEFAGEGSRGWKVYMRCGDELHSVFLDKGYPSEATRLVQGMYDLVVQKRAAEIGKASRFSDDPETADEFMALR